MMQFAAAEPAPQSHLLTDESGYQSLTVRDAGDLGQRHVHVAFGKPPARGVPSHQDGFCLDPTAVARIIRHKGMSSLSTFN